MIPANQSGVLADDLWEPSALFLPNWQKIVAMGTSYRTVIKASRSGAEQRYLLAQKPRRSIGYELRAYNALDSERVRAMLGRMSRARFPCPIWMDGTRLQGQPNLQILQYEGDFTNRRFQVGARVVALEEGTAGIETNFLYATVVAVEDTLITLDTDLVANTFATPVVAGHTSDVEHHPPDAFAVTSVPFFISSGQVMQCGLSWISPVVQSNFVSATLLHSGSGLPASPQPSMVLETGMHTVTRDLGLGVFWLNSAGIIIQNPPLGSYILQIVIANPTIAYITQATVISGVHRTQRLAFSARTATSSGDPWLVETVRLTTTNTNQLALSEFFNGGDEGDADALAPLGASMLGSIEGVPSVLVAAHILQWAVDDIDTLIPQSIGLDRVAFEAEPGSHAFGAVWNPLSRVGLGRGLLFPVMETDLELGNILDAETDSIHGGKIVLVETPGPTALDPQIAAGTTPDGYDSYTIATIEYPILHLPIDWNGVQTGVFRVGKRDRAGITTTIQVFGANPGATFRLPFFNTTRQEAFDLLEFFDSRGGRSFPFILTTPSPLLVVSSIITDLQFTVPQGGNERDWELYKYIGVTVKATGVRSVHEIVTVADNLDGTFIITLIEPLPETDATLMELGTAHLCRFDTDALDEQWLTDNVGTVTLDCIELINEGTFPITLPELCGVGGGVAWQPNECSLCPAAHCGTDDPSGCCACGAFGISVRSFEWLGGCAESALDCNQDGCEPAGMCAIYIPFDTCTDTVIRYARDDTPLAWVELNFTEVTWEWLVVPGNGWLCTEAGVIQDGGCDCLVTECDQGHIITQQCDEYRIQQLCESGGGCELKTIFLICATVAAIRIGGANCIDDP